MHAQGFDERTSEGPARDEQGFRIRRDQPTRVEGFVDAAFAFAVTLLVVSVGRMPESASGADAAVTDAAR